MASEESEMKTCLHCGFRVDETALLDALGQTVEEGGEPEDCTYCPHCDQVFLAEEDYQTRTANVDGEENP